MKKLRIIYSIFQTFVAFLFMCLAYLFVTSTIKNIIASEEVKRFIDASEYERDFDNNTKLYTVDLDLEEESIEFISDDLILGIEGDYFVMPQSRVANLSLVRGFISYCFGGHSGLIARPLGIPSLIEAMGGTSEEAFVFLNQGWGYDLYRPEERSVLGFRVNASLDDRIKASEYATSLVGKDFNYFFIAHVKDKYYCTEVVTRSYSSEAGLDFDLSHNFFDSNQDISISGQSQLIFFKYIDSSGVIHIYYAK